MFFQGVDLFPGRVATRDVTKRMDAVFGHLFQIGGVDLDTYEQIVL